jgi:extracellular factor (EF) 3-hydroxypalmitic acid methyl ester biosynthesis protein
MDRISTDRIVGKLANVERFFSRDVAMFKRRLEELDAQIDPQSAPVKGDPIHRQLLEAFDESQEACARFEAENGHDPTLLNDVRIGFRQETAPWFNRSWIAHRARTKPSGFAGDFEMLIKLYEQATPARGLGGYLDLCILDLPLARAVRARLKSARDFLIREVQSRAGDIRVLNIACGPCREFVDWPAEISEGKIEIVAMDNDPKALSHVKSHVVPMLPPTVELRPTRYNALRTRSASMTVSKFGKFDIIYSVGLCDYLPDEQLIAIFSALQQTLVDNGALYIAFKDTEQYDKTPYQWHLDWFFFQRTEYECLRLYEAAGIRAETMDTSRDDTGIIINFVNRKAAREFVRTDMPESILNRAGGHLPLAASVLPRE